MPNLKKKRISKSKEQVALDLKNRQEVNRFRLKVKEELYPLLLEKSESIADAKMMLQITKMTIQQSLMAKQKELKVSDLEFPKVESKYERFEALMNILKEESVDIAMELCQGMSDAIDSFVKEEHTKRKLSELPAQLLDPNEEG